MHRSFKDIVDVYHYFEMCCGEGVPERSLSELQGLFHVAGCRYEAVSDAFWVLAFGDIDTGTSWAHRQIEWPTREQWAAFDQAGESNEQSS